MPVSQGSGRDYRRRRPPGRCGCRSAPPGGARLRYHPHMISNAAIGSDDPVGPALRDAKRVLREQVLAARDALAAPLRARLAEAIAGRIARLPSFAAARTVLLTLAFRSEWDTLPLVARGARGGQDRRAAARRRRARGCSSCTRSAIPPRTSRPATTASRSRACIAPSSHPAPSTGCWCRASPSTPAGRRLGYGGGFYDRLLPLLAPATARVAGAFDLQIVPRVPAAPHDLAVHAIVTETRTIPAAGE